MRCHLIIEDDPVIPGKVKVETMNILSAAELQVACEMNIDPLTISTVSSQLIAEIATAVEKKICN